MAEMLNILKTFFKFHKKAVISYNYFSGFGELLSLKWRKKGNSHFKYNKH